MMKKILSISISFILLSQLINAQILDYNYHDFYMGFGNLNVADVQAELTFNERQHVLSMIDSFPIYDEYFIGKVSKDPNNIILAKDHVFNYMVGVQLYIIIHEFEAAIDLCNRCFIQTEKYRKEFIDEKFSDMYKELNFINIMSQFYISLTHLMSGDIETTKYQIKKSMELLSRLEVSKEWEWNMSLGLKQLEISAKMADRQCYESQISADKMMKKYIDSEMPEMIKKDSAKVINYVTDKFNVYQFKALAIMCTCDSLKAKGKYIQAMDHVRNESDFFESLNKSFLDKRKIVSGESLISMTSFGVVYYESIKDYEGMEHMFENHKVDNLLGVSKIIWYRDYAISYLSRDIDKAIKNLNIAKDELSKLKIKQTNNQSFRFRFVELSLLLAEAKILDYKYGLDGNSIHLRKAYKVYKVLHEQSIDLRSTQISDISSVYIESELKDIYDKSAINAYLCYKEFNDKNYLNDCILYSENSKSFVLRKNNKQMIQERFRNQSNIKEIFLKERSINNRIKYFQSLIDDEDYGIVVIDSIQFYRRKLIDLNLSVKNSNLEYYFWKKNNIDIDVKEIQDKLKSDQAIFSYLEDPDMPLLHVITHDDINTYSLDSIQYWIDDLISFNEAVREGGNKKIKKLGYKIYQYLLKQGIEGLPESINRITFIPDGEINELNFSAVPLDKNLKQFMIEKYAISYQYSLELFEIESIQSNSDSEEFDFLAYLPSYKGGGGGSLRCSESPLDISKTYVDRISRIFKTKKIVNDALFSDVLSESSKGKIIHFSAHGCVYENQSPFNYNLLMTKDDDNATVDELKVIDIYGLDLDAELVVLGACESGVGQLRDGIGVYSIARAFHYAGCPNTIATKAVVDEAATSEILLLFYQKLVEGDPIDVALQKAKLIFMQNNKNAEPYEWSNIIFIGNPVGVSIN